MQNKLNPNQNIIKIASSKPLPAQERLVTLYLDLDNKAYSPLASLLNNSALLAFSNAGGKINKEATNYLLSCIEATSFTLGNTLTAIGAVVSNPQSAEEYITPLLLSDLACLIGDLLPLLVELSSNLNLPVSSNQEEANQSLIN